MLKRVAGAVIAAVGLALAGPPAHAAAPEPSINATPTVAAPGAQVLVRGSNFPPGQLVRLTICGNGAALGAVDCAQEASQIVPPTQAGTFQTPIPVVVPPKPCPCVIQAWAPSLKNPVLLPIQVVGVATAPVQLSVPPAGQTLRVDKADLTGWGPVGAFFGGAPRRTLVLRLRNTGAEPLDLPAFTLMRGRGARPSTIVDSVALGVIPAGGTRTFRIPVSFDPVSIGAFTVRGSISSQGRPVTFRAKTHATPWGLLVLGALLVQAALVWARNRTRERFVARDPVPGLEPFLTEAIDPLDYWGWWIEPERPALMPAPVHPWAVAGNGDVWHLSPDSQPPDEPQLDPLLAPIVVPDVPDGFRAAGPRHTRSPRSARRDRRSRSH